MRDLTYYRIIKVLRDAYPNYVSSLDISKKTGVRCNIVGSYLANADVEKLKTRNITSYKLRDADLHHLISILDEYIGSSISNETKNVLKEIRMRLEQ